MKTLAEILAEQPRSLLKLTLKKGRTLDEILAEHPDWTRLDLTMKRGQSICVGSPDGSVAFRVQPVEDNQGRLFYRFFQGKRDVIVGLERSRSRGKITHLLWPTRDTKIKRVKVQASPASHCQEVNDWSLVIVDADRPA